MHNHAADIENLPYRFDLADAVQGGRDNKNAIWPLERTVFTDLYQRRTLYTELSGRLTTRRFHISLQPYVKMP